MIQIPLEIGGEYLDTQMSGDQRVIVLEHEEHSAMAKVRLVGIGTVYKARVEYMAPSAPSSDPDYWYTHRHELESGQVFRMYDDTLVKLDCRVAGDGTKWRVADWSNGWAYCDNEIEPGDLRGEPLADPQHQVKQVRERDSGPSGP
jgi:hypothetical protein